MAKPEGADSSELFEMEYDLLSQRAVNESRLVLGTMNGLVRFDTADWSIDQDAGTISFTNHEGGTVAIGALQIIGTYLQSKRAWQWAWANPSIGSALTRNAQLVRQYGQKHQLGHLINPVLTCDPDAAWELGAIACVLAKDQGVYRGATGDTRVIVNFGTLKISKLGR